MGARVGLGDDGHLATHTEGFSYALPLGRWQSDSLAQLLGTPPRNDPRGPCPRHGSPPLPEVHGHRLLCFRVDAVSLPGAYVGG